MAWTTTRPVTDLVVTETMRLTGVITPTALTADTNDYNPAGAADASIWRVGGDRPNRALTGIAGGTTGRIITLVNPGPGPLLLRGEDAGSVAANRLASPTARIDPGTGVTFVYDATLTRWVPLTPLTPTRLDPSTQWVLVDDFNVNGNETGEIGELNWSATNGTFATQTAVQNAPGIVRRTSAATAGQVADTRLSSGTGIPNIRYDEWTEMTWRVSLPQLGADFAVRAGWGDNPSTPPPGQHCVIVERAAADTAWFAAHRNNAAALTRSASLAAEAINTFVTFRFRKIGATVGVQVNRGPETVLSTNLPDAADTGQFFFHVVPTAAAARSVDIDFFSAQGTAINARW